MFQIHSITGRMFIGVTIGLLIGILTVAMLSFLGLYLFSMFGLGTLMFFVLMGLTLGLVGVFDYHPVFGFKMRWWIRGIVAGFLFTLMYILLSYHSIEVMMQSNIMTQIGLNSPFWILIVGIIIGLFMAWIETKFAGEGSSLSLK